VPKPNYGFQKRQKELAKQQKREAKAQRRQERAAEASDQPREPESVSDAELADPPAP
jgi:hypothetical protein